MASTRRYLLLVISFRPARLGSPTKINRIQISKHIKLTKVLDLGYDDIDVLVESKLVLSQRRRRESWL